MRAVLDPNVLVSALISPKGLPARLVDAAEEGRYELVVSPRLFRELEDVLMRPKFRRWFPEEAVPLFLGRLHAVGTPHEEGEIEPVTADPKDDYLVALVAASGAGYLVSGDPHLLDVETSPTGGIAIPILNPREFSEHLRRSG